MFAVIHFMSISAIVTYDVAVTALHAEHIEMDMTK